MVFSPPLISEMLRSSLPGGRAMTSMPLSRMSISSSSTMSAMPPPNSLRNNSWKCVRIDGERVGEQLAAILIDLGDDLFERFLGRGQVLPLGLQLVGPRLQLLQFLERFHVDAAEPAELATQIGDFLLNLRLRLRLRFVGRGEPSPVRGR